MSSVDVFVIGGGPGGYTAAIRAAQLGASVILVERDEVGGVCLNSGCIPTKTMAKSAWTLYLIQKASSLGIEVSRFSLDPKKAMLRKNQVIQRLSKDLKNLLDSNGIQLIRGFGRIIDHRTIEVAREVGTVEMHKASRIIIATGSRPTVPPINGLEGKGVFTSDDALEFEALPDSILIIGGGPLGVEYAQVFHSLGSKVTLVEMMPQLLPLEDRDVAVQLQRFVERMGITVILNAEVKEVKHGEDGRKRVVMGTGKDRREIEYEAVLIATGRTPNSEKLGLEQLGIAVEGGKISVDDKMATNVPDIYAVGDVVGGAYAHVALAQGIVAAENALGMESMFRGKVVPRCIFTVPEVAAVGLTEKEALNLGYNVRTGRFNFTASGAALAMGEAEGFSKVVADSKTGEILGVHIIGSRATESISAASVAMSLEATVTELASVVIPHPTMSEALKEAALAVEGRAINIIKPRHQSG